MGKRFKNVNVSTPYLNERKKYKKSKSANISGTIFGSIWSFLFGLNRKRKNFIIFCMIPILFAYTIFALKMTTAGTNPYHNNKEITTTWYAYQSEWCYVLALLTWFTIVLLYLKDEPVKNIKEV